MREEEIDFVITWVDGGDENWRREKRACREREFGREGGKEAGGGWDGTDDADERYRDWGILQYWFRGVEKYAPWVRKIHFITWGHLPDWLDVSHPKLHIVRHEDYIPPEYLPTFNSHTIEWNMHRIEGLSEQFVYFNDDMLLIDELKKEDFFIGGKPCDMLAFQPVVANPENPVMTYIYMNNALALSKHFSKRENVKRQPGNYFKVGYPPLYFFYNLLEMVFPRYTGFFTAHGAAPFLKGTYRELWEKEAELLDSTCRHRFRDKGDVSQYLAREWQKLSGNFRAKNVLRGFRYFDVKSDNPALMKTIARRKAKIVCVNDANEPIDFARAKRQVMEALEQALPEKSSFEK